MDWLQDTVRISAADARSIVVRLGLSSDRRFCMLAGNPRKLLGLEAAWASGADVILFDTVGCDPLGVDAVFKAVNARLDRCAAIYLSTPYLQNEQRKRACLPGACCMEVEPITGMETVAVQRG